AGKHVHGTRVRHRIVGLVAIDAGGGTVFIRSRYGERVAVSAQCDGKPELVIRPRVRSLDIGLLSPARAGAGVDVNGARTVPGIILPFTVDAGGRTAFHGSAQDRKSTRLNSSH